jgi:nitrate/nitrite transporter NarK
LGPHFCIDIPSVLGLSIEKQFDVSQTQWSMLLVCFYLPNVVLPLIAGIFIDKVGIRCGYMIFSVVLTFGQMIIATGAHLMSFPLMMVGTLILGMGCECFMVAQHSLLTCWFRDQGFGFVMGLNLSSGKLGAGMNSLISPWIAKRFGNISYVYFFGFLIITISMVGNIFIVALDRRADREAQKTCCEPESQRPNKKKEECNPTLLKSDDSYQY